MTYETERTGFAGEHKAPNALKEAVLSLAMESVTNARAEALDAASELDAYLEDCNAAEIVRQAIELLNRARASIAGEQDRNNRAKEIAEGRTA